MGKPRNLNSGGSGFLNYHSSTIAQNFRRRPFADDLRSVVSYPNDGVGAELLGVLNHRIVGLLTRLLAHFGVSTDTSADDVFQAANDTLCDRGRPDDDSSNQAFVFGDLVARDVKRSCNKHKGVVVELSDGLLLGKS